MKFPDFSLTWIFFLIFQIVFPDRGNPVLSFYFSKGHGIGTMWEDWSKIAYFEELARASKTSIWHWLSYNIYLHITLKTLPNIFTS